MSDICSLAVTVGVGQAQLARWGFDSLARQCRQFVYLGLRGNQNNFGSREACEAQCPGESRAPAPSPPSVRQPLHLRHPAGGRQTAAVLAAGAVRVQLLLPRRPGRGHHCVLPGG